ncbi:HXXEE domain-containing protein [Cupriavidus metallidurans]|uniref:HXXEE domain-containing protein n=1 Tax=Cupriavidus metallidurans TaxID=119219 RepID=UPI0013626D98|nr:HXXEE domain-containing protein [Cupriavidus metallidurans]
MTELLMSNLINIVSALGFAAFIFVLARWSGIPILQRMVGIQFFFVALHINEELRIPGGFVEMVEERLHFTLVNPHFGELVLSAVVLLMFGPPLLFPRRIFLTMVPMVLGVFEFVMHTLGIWMFDRHVPYTPGLATATCLLLPVGVYSIRFAIKNKLMRAVDWLFVFLYMLFCVGMAQQIVVRSTGMSYLDFLRNVRKSILGE